MAKATYKYNFYYIDVLDPQNIRIKSYRYDTPSAHEAKEKFQNFLKPYGERYQKVSPPSKKKKKMKP